MIVVSLVSEVFYPVLPGGFAQFFRYGPGLRERGVQLRVHTTLKPEHGEERELTVNGVEIRRHPMPDGIDLIRERLLLMRLALAGMEDDPEGTKHCLQPNGDSWGANALLWRSRMRGIPSSVYYTMFPHPPAGKLHQRLLGRVRLGLIQAPYSKLIVCSTQMREAYRKLAGIWTGKTVVLPNGVDLEHYSPPADRGEFRRKLGLPEGVPLVLTSGSVVPRKGTDVLLDAWERVGREMPDAVLVICGSVGMRPTFRDSGMSQELIEFTRKIEKRLEGDNSVILAGEVDNIQDYYRAADVFAFTSRREGLPNAVLEAMASGLPGVIAPFAGIPGEGEEFGRDGEHFVRSSHDPSVLAVDLLDLLGSREKQEAMGAGARRLMEQTQRMDTTLDVLAGYYRATVGG